mgnify:CR=1 FL=1
MKSCRKLNHSAKNDFPVIFSINLFLWFIDDLFYMQFLLVALGFAGKELLQWNKEGRRVHIFNPSSFPLAIFSLGLILTGTSDLTWGQDIAITQFYPPHVYLVLFLVALPGQYLFGVTSMTVSAVVATYAFGLLYSTVTGIYFFYDSYVPIAVFLGMHLLFTDPSTAPRTELGRIMFGVLYGLSTVGLYVLLGRAGVPPFYDKLLQVPVLNLSIQLLPRSRVALVLLSFTMGCESEDTWSPRSLTELDEVANPEALVEGLDGPRGLVRWQERWIVAEYGGGRVLAVDESGLEVLVVQRQWMITKPDQGDVCPGGLGPAGCSHRDKMVPGC